MIKLKRYKCSNTHNDNPGENYLINKLFKVKLPNIEKGVYEMN